MSIRLASKYLNNVRLADIKAFSKSVGLTHKESTKIEMSREFMEYLAIPSVFEDTKRIDTDRNDLNILSIDMGMRNFSFCRLSLPVKNPNVYSCIPTIHEWHKLDAMKFHNGETDVSATLRSDEHNTQLYTKIAYKVVNEIIFNPKYPTPDVILIEQQRLRSNSSRMILEWVTRIVMFENMLHAVIYTLQASDAKKQNSLVLSTSPKKMAEFWQSSSGGKVKGDPKKGRIELVSNWMDKVLETKNETMDNSVFVLDWSIMNKLEKLPAEVFSTKSKNRRLYRMIVEENDSYRPEAQEKVTPSNRAIKVNQLEEYMQKLNTQEKTCHQETLQKISMKKKEYSDVKVSEKVILSEKKKLLREEYRLLTQKIDVQSKEQKMVEYQKKRDKLDQTHKLHIKELTSKLTAELNEIKAEESELIKGLTHERDSVRKTAKMNKLSEVRVAEKSDDIVDALLHALTFLQWQKNIYTMRKCLLKGEDLDDELMRGIEQIHSRMMNEEK